MHWSCLHSDVFDLLYYIALYCAVLHCNVLGGLSKTDIASVPSMCPLQILSLCFEVSYIKQYSGDIWHLWIHKPSCVYHTELHLVIDILN